MQYFVLNDEIVFELYIIAYYVHLFFIVLIICGECDVYKITNLQIIVTYTQNKL